MNAIFAPTTGDPYRAHHHSFGLAHFVGDFMGMPMVAPATDQFRCSCSHIFVLLSKTYETDALVECPRCGEWHTVLWR